MKDFLYFTPCFCFRGLTILQMTPLFSSIIVHSSSVKSLEHNCHSSFPALYCWLQNFLSETKKFQQLLLCFRFWHQERYIFHIYQYPWIDTFCHHGLNFKFPKLNFDECVEWNCWTMLVFNILGSTDTRKFIIENAITHFTVYCLKLKIK